MIKSFSDHIGFWHYWENPTFYEVADYGICPHGSIKFNFKINPEFENDIKGIR